MKLVISKLAEVEEGSDIEIVQWFKHEGDPVAKGEKLVEVLIGKASIEIESPAAGTLKHIIHKDNEIVAPDDEIALIEE